MRRASMVLPDTGHIGRAAAKQPDPLEHTVILEIHEPRAETRSGWARRVREEAPALLCACGCGRSVVVKGPHRSSGLPRFIHGHHSNPIRRAYAQLRAKGFLLLGEACSQLGISEKVYRRL